LATVDGRHVQRSWMIPADSAVSWPTLGTYVIMYSMKTMSATELRGNLAAALDAIENDAEELVITRAGHEPLVVVSLAEYASLRETDYLLRSPANADHLRRSLQEFQEGRAQNRELIDPEDQDLTGQTA
jgi:antitoxin YefM